MIDQLPKNKKIILFDGVCNLCNNSINYVIDKDKQDIFRFVSLQSDLGQEIQQYIGYRDTSLNTIILYVPGEAYYTKSTAAIKIIKEFGGLWKGINLFLILPENIRNIAYNYVAKNRYKWYGKEESCRIPTPELKSKFL
ncbi:thiol-disulfide oxidoreductase DCC family protein [Pseudofulvibacter geojedonensis]|uniref:Thiol-disulfide oxidoreductase DCC family protein n=1 Tax=Pseudofulvibacter geojedonensis TaxID=1123758 RepID=A0ABW3HXY0_9FLAO